MKLLIAVIVLLIIINSIVLILSGCDGGNLLVNIALYVVEIIATIWIIIGNERKK